jgi:hypothetical protein
MSRIATLFAFLLTGLFTLACTGEPLDTPRDVSGRWDVAYDDTLRIFIDDQLIATVEPGSSETITWNGQTFEASAVCGDPGTTCPSDAFWATMDVAQPMGDDNRLLEFVEVVDEQRTAETISGFMEDDGTFAMLAGLDVESSETCLAIGVGTVEGQFVDGDTRIDDAAIAVTWSAGCQFGGVTIDAEVRLETDVSAVRR